MYIGILSVHLQALSKNREGNPNLLVSPRKNKILHCNKHWRLLYLLILYSVSSFWVQKLNLKVPVMKNTFKVSKYNTASPVLLYITYLVRIVFTADLLSASLHWWPSASLHCWSGGSFHYRPSFLFTADQMLFRTVGPLLLYTAGLVPPLHAGQWLL
jgi:hypothetical protein